MDKMEMAVSAVVERVPPAGLLLLLPTLGTGPGASVLGLCRSPRRISQHHS